MNPETPSSQPNPTPVPSQPNSSPQPVSPAPPQEPVAPISNGSATPGAAAPKKPGSGRKKMLVALLVVVVVLVLAVVAAVLIHNHQQKKSGKYSISLLTIGSTGPFSPSYYPNMQTDTFSQEINAQAFEGLTQFRNKNQVVPDLATSWTNPDNLTWVFQLKQGVKFHNGDTMTSTQVADSLLQFKNYPPNQLINYDIKSVTPEGPNSVKVVTSQPDPLLESKLALMWIWDTSAKTKNNLANGTGPYTLAPGNKPSQSGITLAASSNYHGSTPLVKSVQYVIYNSVNPLITAMQQKKLDMVDLSVWPSYVNQVKPAGYDLYDSELPLVYFLIPNTVAPGPLQNLKVRQAIYESLNPEAIAKAHNGDSGMPANQLVTPAIPGYNPNITRPAFDPTAAKALLAQAGYPNGISLKLTFDPTSQGGEVQEITKELAVIGVTIKPDPHSDVSVLQQTVVDGSTDLYVIGYNSEIVDTSDVASNLVIDNPFYSNPQVDKLFNEQAVNFNPTTRLAQLQQLNAAVMNDVGVFPLYIPTDQYFAYKPGLVLKQQTYATETGLYFNQVYSTKPLVN